MEKNNILDTIIAYKREEVLIKKALLPLPAIKEKLTMAPSVRNFATTILSHCRQKKPAIIAEIKKASPSKGIIRQSFDPVAIAKNYEEHEALCLSVLTDEKFFQGSDVFLQAVRMNTSLPLLRKDFIVDSYQVYESRMLGADCILLIVAVLNDDELSELSHIAKTLELSVLVECHDENDIKRALHLDTPLIGINNRNLKTFETSLNTTFSLLPLIPENRIVITESGIHTKEQIQRMLDNNVYGFLIGECFMRAENPGEKLHELFFS